MTYLGIDQSLNGTGLCLLADSGAVQLLETVDPDSRRGGERLHFIKSRVLSTVNADTKFVCQEGYSYNSIGHVFELGEIGGVIKLLLFESGLPLVVVPPVSLKKFATGNTGADKEAMVAAALREGIKTDDDNQADAFFLAMIARYIHTGTNPPIRARLEVLQQLRNPALKKPKRRIRYVIKNTI